MKLWVDDERPAPEGWLWAKNSHEAVGVLSYEWPAGRVTDLSLDHDLGGEDTTRSVVTWMVMHGIWPERIYVHTANPVGREWLEGMINKYGPGVSK